MNCANDIFFCGTDASSLRRNLLITREAADAGAITMLDYKMLEAKFDLIGNGTRWHNVCCRVGCYPPDVCRRSESLTATFVAISFLKVISLRSGLTPFKTATAILSKSPNNGVYVKL